MRRPSSTRLDDIPGFNIDRMAAAADGDNLALVEERTRERSAFRADQFVDPSAALAHGRCISRRWSAPGTTGH